MPKQKATTTLITHTTNSHPTRIAQDNKVPLTNTDDKSKPKIQPSQTTIIEMTDMLPRKGQKECPLLTTVEKNKTNITPTPKKGKAAKRQEVTIKMYSNLKNAFNNIDNEMTMFAGKYQRDQ